ncbi:MAG: DUF1206 domain-containing protein [Acidimicrobiia bacterium]
MPLTTTAPGAKAADGVEILGRAGLAARGLVYLLVGWLALLVAFGDHGRQADREGAVATIAARSYGTALLAALALGMVGYAVWRATEAATGRTSREADADAGTRLRSLATAVLHIGFAISIARFAVTHRGDGGEEEQSLTAVALGWPGGRLLVAGAGLAVVGVGLFNGYRAVTGSFMERLKRGELGDASERTVRVLGTAGHLGRGAGFTLVGLFVVRAAITLDPTEAKGLDGALKEVAAEWYGPPVLVVLAAGFAAFGVYSLAEARWRRVLGR